MLDSLATQLKPTPHGDLGQSALDPEVNRATGAIIGVVLAVGGEGVSVLGALITKLVSVLERSGHEEEEEDGNSNTYSNNTYQGIGYSPGQGYSYSHGRGASSGASSRTSDGLFSIQALRLLTCLVRVHRSARVRGNAIDSIINWFLQRPEEWIDSVRWLKGATDPFSQDLKPGMDTVTARHILTDMESLMHESHFEVEWEKEKELKPEDYLIEVCGAGTEWLNGRYYLEGEYCGYPKYERWGNKPGFGSYPVSIYRAKMNNGAHMWFIGIMANSQAGVASDQDYYKSEELKASSLMMLPPRHRSQWRVAQYPLGKHPMPSVTKILLSEVSDAIENEAETHLIGGNMEAGYDSPSSTDGYADRQVYEVDESPQSSPGLQRTDTNNSTWSDDVNGVNDLD